jgi:hypothetical protein
MTDKGTISAEMGSILTKKRQYSRPCTVFVKIPFPSSEITKKELVTNQNTALS